MKTTSTTTKSQNSPVIFILFVSVLFHASGLYANNAAVLRKVAKTYIKQQHPVKADRMLLNAENMELPNVSIEKQATISDTFSDKMLLNAENMERTNVNIDRRQMATIRAKALTQSMDCEIGLQASQYTAVDAINLAACLKMDAARIKNNWDYKKLVTERIKIENTRTSALKKVLTPRQFMVYDKISRGGENTLKATKSCHKTLAEIY